MTRRWTRWTTLQIADLARRIAAGFSNAEIAALTGRTPESIRQRRRRLTGKIPRGR